MFGSGFIRMAVLGLLSVALSQASPISLGFISFNNIGSSGLYTVFNINNWTQSMAPGYDVLSAVNLTNVSLTIDHQNNTAESVLATNSMTPHSAAYASIVIPVSNAITRAILRATLDASQPWRMTHGSLMMPRSNLLEMILLPYDGMAFQPGVDSWEIQLDAAPVATPEPGGITLWLTPLAAGLMALRRRRSYPLPRP